ncbi:MAG TPA: hypothetical protein VES66_01940 [Terriglobales bacterium]|nr:hypothetical protein [Terriglobales bacterium]
MEIGLCSTSDEAYNGIDLAIRVRQDFAQSKILLFSGQAATANMLEHARAEGHDFEVLAKPVHPAQLLAKVADLLAGFATASPQQLAG